MKKFALIILAISICVLLVVIFFYFKANQGVSVTTTHAVTELIGFKAINGKHCESSAMLNALRFQGVDIDENLINGFGSSLGFIFIKDSGFPFLGTRNTYLKENFSKATGINYQEIKATNSQQAYDSAKKILKQGIPVVLRVDMRYLPYLWGGRYGSKYTSFGWHFVTLVKLDEKAGFAWVTDTNRGLCRVKIPNLMKARASREGFLQADNYAYYFVNPAAVKINYRAALNNSLETLISEYQKPNGVLTQLKEFPSNIEKIETFVPNKYMLKPLFFTFYGYIDEFGTGGSGFRNFYRDFLAELGAKLNDVNLTQVSAAVNNSCQKWHTLAVEFKQISETIDKHYGDSKFRKQQYQTAMKKATELLQAETEMLNQLKKLDR